MISRTVIFDSMLHPWPRLTDKFILYLTRGYDMCHVKNISFLIALLSSSIFCFSQSRSFDIQRKYAVADILEDIDYTETYLLKYHPDPFRYISKDSLHAFVVRTKAKIDVPLTEMQVRFYLKQIVAKIGCGHTDVLSSKPYQKTVVKLSRPILPLNTILTSGDHLMIVNNLSSDTTNKAGDEIITLDHHPVPEVLTTIYSTFTTDGYNETYKKRGLRYEWFKYFYSFCYSFHTPYEVSVKKPDGSITSHTIAAISSLKDTLMLPKKDSIVYLQKTKKLKYFIIDHTKPLAVIDIDGFSGRHWRRFFRKTFRDIRQKKIEHLVIDLRDNGGGQIGDGFNFLSYLVDKPLVLPFDRKPNLPMLDPRYKMNVFTRLTPLVFTLAMPQWIKHGRLRHYMIRFPKHRNAYQGHVYVLVNGKSFSMSVIAATYLKYKAQATIIGDETGGNVAGSNAMISGNLLLPHTKVRVYIPMYHIYHDVKVINDGHGLMPDIPTSYSIGDILNAVDVDMNKVKELVK